MNALVHRDYGIEGAKCQLVVHEDKAVVMNPGRPVSPITLKQLESFETPMLSRNPVLHFVFARMRLAEERGLGLRSMRTRAQEAGLPLPSFSFRDPYVVLTVYREAGAALLELAEDVSSRLTESERSGWGWIATQTSFTKSEYQEAMDLADRTAKRHLAKLTDLGLLRRVGAGRGTRYEVVRS